MSSSETSSGDLESIRKSDFVERATSIILPGRKRGSYEYPDLLVSMEIGLQGYNHEVTWSKLKVAKEIMLTLRQEVDRLNLLKSDKPVYNGNGKRIPKEIKKALYLDAVKPREPWRASWLDNLFVDNTISYHRINSDGTLKLVIEPLEDCLMDDRNPGLSLEDWLKRATNQGLPPKDVKKGSLFYLHPRQGSVALFFTYSSGAGLDCGRLILASIASLGVRMAKVFYGRYR